MYGLGKRLFIQAMGGPGENSLRFASSLAAALLDGLYGQPQGLMCDGLGLLDLVLPHLQNSL